VNGSTGQVDVLSRSPKQGAREAAEDSLLRI